MGTMVESGEHVSVAYFSETVHEVRQTRLAAVVAWREDRSAIKTERASFWQFLRSLFLRQARNAPEPSEWQPPDEWSGTVDRNGKNEVLFHKDRRVVRTREREFTLPADGRTLVVLIDEQGLLPDAEPVFTIHSIKSPALPHFSYDRSLSKKVNLKQMMKSNQEEAKAVRLAVHSDPVVRAFLDRAD